MKFNFILCLGVALSTSAFAGTQELVSLSCSGANGLRLELQSETGVVRTRVGALTKNFETDGVVSTRGGSVKVTRITLGLVGSPNAHVYEIYLSQAPSPGQAKRLSGVIGRPVYGVGFAANEGPVPAPVGFAPSTVLACEILTQ